MSEVAELLQHVLDNRFLQGLVERLLQLPPEDEIEELVTTEKVGWDLEDAVAHRRCDCDPDKRGAEGSDEDTDQEDGWFCSFRNIEDDYHYNVEQAKLLKTQEQTQDSSDDQEPTCPSPSPRPCVFPPFSLQHLPPEVLVEILLFAQAADPHVHITLSHVNAYLRTFVNSTPLLWAHVDFLYPLHLVHLYFKRSADVLLRVVVLPPYQNASRFLKDVTANENRRVMQFMRALYPHRHRVLSLRLRCRDFRFAVSVEEQIPASEFLWDGSMVKLKLFDLELDNSLWRGQTVPSSSSIRDLRLHGPWTAFFTPLLSSLLTSLTLTDDDTSFAEVISALQAAPCLVSLTLRNMSLVRAPERGGSLLTLDQLESLSLIRVSPTAMQALFSCITAPNLVLSLLGKPDITGTACPNLKHLTIDNEFNPITGLIRLTAVSRHSAGIPLESVTLRGIPMDVAAYDDISLGEIIPKLDIGGFDQELDVYGDTDRFSASATSSEGDWASGDEEIVKADRKYRQLFTFEEFVHHTFDGDWETEG
ncbi:hypothetical protein FRC05_005770 [Tulasnella sp. 425]|nr:hypothetical protein FRC05_005770 [Tulasnella sp. 425]